MENSKCFYFFCLLLFLFCFFQNFQKNLTATVDATLQYHNLPNKTVVTSDIINKISFDLTTSGFDFLYYKINKPIISINVEDYYKKGSLEIFISTSELSNIISSQLKNTKGIINSSINDMIVTLDVIETKKIPILLLSDIVFQNGYKVIDSLRIVPDSILISGPSKMIDSIKNIKTKVLTMRSVKEDISEEIEMGTINSSTITYSLHKVQLSSRVKEFTQKVLVLPFVVKNLPFDTNIKLIPETITITFDVSLDDFNIISASDFIAICDYNKRNDEENFYDTRIKFETRIDI